jgi:hypothetical protein
MARTKKDFLEYARQRAVATGEFGDSTPDYSPDTGGTESIGGSVLTADVSYDAPVEESISDAATIQRADEPDYGSEQGETRRDIGSDFSSDGSTDSASTIDYPIRNYNPGSDYTYPTAARSPIRAVTKRRTSFADRALDFVAGKTQSREQKIKAATAAGVKVARKFLTIAEVSGNRGSLIKLVLWSSENLDAGISAITKGHAEVEIWSNIEYADAEILVDAALEMGQKSEKWATAVRQVIDYQKKIKVGVILAPRIYRSIVYTIVTGVDLRI